MRTENSAGRLIGVLIIIQMALAVMVNFVLEAPLFGQPGFLVNAAHYSRQLGVAVLLGLLTEALWLGIAVTAFPLFYRYNRTLTLWFTALAVVVLASAVAENSAVMSMVSLSEAYAKANTADRGQIEAIRSVVAAENRGGGDALGQQTIRALPVLYRRQNGELTHRARAADPPLIRSGCETSARATRVRTRAYEEAKHLLTS